MNKEKSPRWVNEIPGIKNHGKTSDLTEQQKREAEEFEEAVLSGKIDEWFNKK